MMYAVISNGAVMEYPVTPSLRCPNTSFPDQWLGGSVEGIEFVIVRSTELRYNPDTQAVEEGEPVLIDGVWAQQWFVRDLTQEELSARLTAKRKTQVVSPFQAKAALLTQGLLDDVEALVVHQDTDPLIRLAWHTASEFRRTSPSVLGMAQALGWSEQDLDDLFNLAASLEV